MIVVDMMMQRVRQRAPQNRKRFLAERAVSIPLNAARRGMTYQIHDMLERLIAKGARARLMQFGAQAQLRRRRWGLDHCPAERTLAAEF
jgi:hypothetical protein